MKNKNGFTESPSTILTCDIIEPSPAKRSLSVLLSSRARSLMLQDSMLEAVNDHYRAMLAAFLLLCYNDYRRGQEIKPAGLVHQPHIRKPI